MSTCHRVSIKPWAVTMVYAGFSAIFNNWQMLAYAAQMLLRFQSLYTTGRFKPLCAWLCRFRKHPRKIPPLPFLFCYTFIASCAGRVSPTGASLLGFRTRMDAPTVVDAAPLLKNGAAGRMKTTPPCGHHGTFQWPPMPCIHAWSMRLF